MRMRNGLKRGIAIAIAASMLTTSGCSNVESLIHNIGLDGTNGKGQNTQIAEEQPGKDNTKDNDTDNSSNKNVNDKNTDGGQQHNQGAGNALGAVYSGNKIKIKRDEIINIDIGYDYDDYNEERMNVYDAFEIYTDSTLTIKEDGIFAEYNSDTGKIEIDPGNYSVGLFSKYAGTSEIEAEIATLPKSVVRGTWTEDTHTWGNLPRYYLVSYIDVETGKKLSTPEITVIEIDEEIPEAPRVTFSQTDDGSCRIYWKPVEGAEKYVIYALPYSKEYGYGTSSDVITITDQTEWVQDAKGYYENSGDYDEVYEMNQQFYGGMIKTEGFDDAVYIGVLAVNSSGASSFSNMAEVEEIRATLPYKCAYGDEADSETDAYNSGCLDYVSELPSTAQVKMCDKSIVPKVIEYDIDNCEYNETVNWLCVNAKIVGTLFTQKFTIYNPDKATYKEELAKIKERQDSLIKKGGDTLGPEVTITDGEPDTPDTPETPDTPDTPEEPEVAEDPSQADTSDVYGNSELSRYIGSQMLKTVSAIDVSSFPESADSDELLDAFYEAKNQNPLILGIRTLEYDSNSRILYVGYDYDPETTAQKQQEVKAKVDEVISSIITDGMSDLEKEMAINDYICDNAVYDDAACENAESYDFYNVDKEFYDSFTAYGILINGVGVCASYAADFKLLADAAGLESRIVTGMLEGSSPHAWNKVKIDGQWCIVDATNNDSDYLKNGLLNLSDDAAMGVLTQSDEFVLDGNVSDYAAVSDDKEYYHINGKFFSKDEIASKLADEIKENQASTLRTDYDLSESEFNSIAREAAKQAGTNITGGYWFGMIYLEKE